MLFKKNYVIFVGDIGKAEKICEIEFRQKLVHVLKIFITWMFSILSFQYYLIFQDIIDTLFIVHVIIC